LIGATRLLIERRKYPPIKALLREDLKNLEEKLLNALRGKKWRRINGR